MAWPSNSDIDTTKFDEDSDKISESRPELLKMAGYVNDIIDAGPSGVNTFSTINANGTSVIADSSSDTLNLVAGSNIEITANATTDTITIASTATSGVSSILAGSGISVDQATGNVTITATGGGGGGGNIIENGTSKVEIPGSNGNIEFTANGIKKMTVNTNANVFGVVGVEFDTSISCDRLFATNLNIQNPGDLAAQFAGNVECSSGSFLGTLVGTVDAVSGLTVASNSRNITANIAGSLGQIRAITDRGGKLVYWDTTNNRWSYIHDNSAL
jgi:hypothetical protein